MTVAEQQFEGEFRYVNSRLITNCEEIAFYNGSRREKLIIRDAFERLVRERERESPSFSVRLHLFTGETSEKSDHLPSGDGLYR